MLICMAALKGSKPNDEQRNWNLFPTILSGAIGSSGETDNSYQLLVSTSAEGIVIDGFDIRKAYNEVSIRRRFHFFKRFLHNQALQ
jgi:hypothetical protein